MSHGYHEIFLDVDECSLSLENCHENSSCTNFNGSFLCTCDNGYTGNGTVCEGKQVSHVVQSNALILRNICLVETNSTNKNFLISV